MKKQKKESRRSPQRAAPSPRKSGFWFRFLTMAAVVAAVLACLTLFFQVSELHVTGNHIYSEEQVIDASGISVGDNLVAIKKANAASLIMSTLPFVESVHIERQLPNCVNITVTESDVTFAIRAQNETYYLINTQGKVLQEIQTANAPDYPNVEGLTVSEPTIGAAINVPDEEAENESAALSLMQLLNDYGIAGSISTLDVTKAYDIRLQYGTQYEILLGGNDNLSYKIEYLGSVLEQLGETQSGVIDLTFEEDKTARFQPY
ncbi:MAG: FtsQ-type POTRA domain-containing protein [Oscillospiraceae bacterium]|nr:FtsQ-type POTRA domain-containing protein [Oscillospiraceae bacterium]